MHRKGVSFEEMLPEGKILPLDRMTGAARVPSLRICYVRTVLKMVLQNLRSEGGA